MSTLESLASQNDATTKSSPLTRFRKRRRLNRWHGEVKSARQGRRAVFLLHRGDDRIDPANASIALGIEMFEEYILIGCACIE